MSAIHDASVQQRAAADPARTTWLKANAGSGKTKVLTDRVARLLLSNVPPANILCLTFTKAAAGEMQNRLFRTLAAWSMADDAALAEQLAAIGHEVAPNPSEFARARRLFARAIDTPGGLKIQTIHAFAAGLLRQFPLEAGVSPNFRELDSLSAQMLQRQVLSDMAEHEADAQVLSRLLTHVSPALLDKVCAQIIGEGALFAQFPDRDAQTKLFGIASDIDAQTVIANLFSPTVQSVVQSAVPILNTGKPTDQGFAKVLATVDFAHPNQAQFDKLASVFLTDKGETRKSVATSDLRKKMGALYDELTDLAADVYATRLQLLNLEAYDANLAFHEFAARFSSAYALAKTSAGQLDFDDLIDKAAALLEDPMVAAWVLWKLDGRIDHILVDEAQDTSPAQWRIIDALAREFTVGEGARGGLQRTLFVVGDPKQSIFRFQGADLSVFVQRESHFQQAFLAAGLPFQSRPLQHSFRTSPLLLDLVDQISPQLPGLGETAPHIAVRDALPGRIDLLPPVLPDAKAEADTFGAVDERYGLRQPAQILAEDLASRLKAMLDREMITDKSSGEARPLRAGDVLVLLRKRSDFMLPFIAACKRHGLPIAGADSLILQHELAVRDVLSLLAFIDLPDDDLALAEALRSPLFALSEQALFTLAHHRAKGQTLWSALRDAPDHAAIVNRLGELLNLADVARPFELIETVLTAQDGRQALAKRLGPECHDPLDSLLSRALDYERVETPSLTGFLIWFAEETERVKRPVGQGEDVIRVMTIHGSKGLEAPVVILPDTATKTRPSDSRILTTEAGAPVFLPRSARQIDLHHDLKTREAEAIAAEADRLLYVALTRAQSWLIVACFADKEPDADSWYGKIAAVLAGWEGQDIDGARRFSRLDWPADRPKVTVGPEVVVPHLDLGPIPALGGRGRSLSPSQLVTAQGNIGTSDEDAKARGILIHTLLERLSDVPAGDRRDLALALAQGATGFDVPAAIDEAMSVLDLPLFRFPAVVEVGFAADLPRYTLPLVGRIDRLVAMDDHLLIVDFKSDRAPPMRPELVGPAYLAQLAAYRDSLAPLFLGRVIRTAILWTATQVLMEMPDDIVMDVGQPATTS